MKKILVYSHDAYGLGNIRRMLEITTHLVQSDPDVSVLLISGSPMLHAFRIPDRVDYIKLPCIARSEKGEAIVKTLGLSYDATLRLRADVIASAVADFEPDLVLVDKKPFGIGNELEPAFRLMRRRARRPHRVLLLRDILDEAKTTTAQWRKGRYHEAIDEHYDQVLVVGSAAVFDAAREYDFPRSTCDKLRYCGYIRRPAPRRGAAEVRREYGLGLDDRPLVLVTAGGGGDGYAMMWNYLTALGSRPKRRHATLLVSGPEMSAAQRAEIGRLADAAGDVVFREFTDDMMSCMNAADVVVAMGGYNTVCELLTLQKRMIIVPRVEPVQEQWLRAERMERMGLLRALHPDQLSPDALLDAVEEELSCSTVRRLALQTFAMDGLPRIADALRQGMADADAEAQAQAEAAARSFRRPALLASLRSPVGQIAAAAYAAGAA